MDSNNLATQAHPEVSQVVGGPLVGPGCCGELTNTKKMCIALFCRSLAWPNAFEDAREADYKCNVRLMVKADVCIDLLAGVVFFLLRPIRS